MLISTLQNHEDILLPSVIDLPDGWQAEREFFLSRSIRSLIIIPIFTEANLIGFVGLDSVRDRKVYTASEINNLKIWSSLIGSLINSKRIEKAFQQTKKNYETFFNTIDEFVWVLDDKGNIIDVNKTVTEKLKFSFSELYNQSILTVHPKERIEDAARISEEMLAGTTEISMIPLLTKSGTQVPVETHVKQGFWDEKPVMFAVSKDISQIMLSEQKFSTAFHSNPAMMAIVELDTGKFVDINNAFIETMGFQRDEIIGKTSKELNLFIDSNLKKKILKQINHNQPIKKLEHLFLTKDGRKRTGMLSTDLIYIGEKRCLLLVSSDITEIKDAELETKKARIEAEEASKSKSEFLSRMSHELRTPLNAILGFAQLLQMGELNTSQKKGVDHILQGGKNLLELINEVLDITRIDTGNLSLSIEPVKIGDLFPEMIDTIRPLVSEKQVTLNISDAMINLYSVKADRKRLQQVLLNLLNNAVKYNKVGGSVSVVTEMIHKENNLKYVRISMTDTGVGIQEDDIQKLFKPFERVGNHQNASEGTGLGLAVVKKLVAAMEGYVGVESKFGEGSTFWIELPHSEIHLKAKTKANDHPL
jgi:PAS domain S-box-containing protein